MQQRGVVRKRCTGRSPSPRGCSMTSAAGMKYWRKRHGSLAFVEFFHGRNYRLIALPYMAQVLLRRGRTAEAAATCRGVPAASHVMLVMRRSWFRRSPWLHVVATSTRRPLCGRRTSSRRSSRRTRGVSDFHRARFLHELATVCVEAGDLDVMRRLVDSIRTDGRPCGPFARRSSSRASRGGRGSQSRAPPVRGGGKALG